MNLKKAAITLTTLFAVALGLSARSGSGGYLYRGRGYAGSVEAGMTFGLTEKFGMQPTLFTSHGYRDGGGAYVGVGCGVITDLSDVVAPLFVDLKYAFRTNSSTSPFIGVRVGAVTDLSYVGGLVSPAVGVDMGAFSFRFSYWYSECRIGDCQPVPNRWLNATIAVMF